MVLHDATLTRTTGQAGAVHDRTAGELMRIDAGEPRRFGTRYRGTTIPRLDDVIGLLDGRPDVTLFVEIKRESLVRFGPGLVVDRIVRAMAPRRHQCVAISFDLPVLSDVRAQGHPAVGWVLSDIRTKSQAAAQALNPEFLFVDHKKLRRTGALWPGPWQWVVYEVATLPLARMLERRGVQFIETMAVERMAQALS
jgi:glycerophosphoryl diester phosphodiesterase